MALTDYESAYQLREDYSFDKVGSNKRLNHTRNDEISTRQSQTETNIRFIKKCLLDIDQNSVEAQEAREAAVKKLEKAFYGKYADCKFQFEKGNILTILCLTKDSITDDPRPISVMYRADYDTSTKTFIVRELNPFVNDTISMGIFAISSEKFTPYEIQIILNRKEDN